MHQREIKKIILITSFIFIACLFFNSATPKVMADNESGTYTVLAPLPGTTSGVCDPANPDANCQTTLSKYVPGLFKLLIGLAAAAAVLMIIWGGVQYMTSDAIQGKSAGKERIKNAIMGLVLVIASWLVLNTINPNLLKIDLNIDPTITNSLGGDGGIIYSDIIATPEQGLAEANARLALTNIRIGVNRMPCLPTSPTRCTNVGGLPQTAILGLTSLQQACSNCVTTLTGGTEGGHTTHGPGIATVDLAKNTALDSFIKTGHTAVSTQWGPKYTFVINGQQVTFLEESSTSPGSTGAHWHVQF